METPERIGPYWVRSLIARGGMGEVWRARHPTLDRDVAVKLIRADLGDRLAMREMFTREIQILSKLRSPQTVQVIDANLTEDGHPYIVTEFLEGQDLQAHLKHRGNMEVGEAVQIVCEVLRSLAEAHAVGLVHRDVKPANVFLQQLPGGGTAVKVLDFGVAKILAGTDTDDTLAGGPSLKGSPRYMAPEQIRGLPLSAQTDLYAVGGLLYHLICGEPCFHVKGREALLRAHLEDVPIPLSERCPLFDVPPALDAVVLQCLKKAPRERPWGARELLAALLKAVGVAEGWDMSQQAVGAAPVARPSLSGSSSNASAVSSSAGTSALGPLPRAGIPSGATPEFFRFSSDPAMPVAPPSSAPGAPGEPPESAASERPTMEAPRSLAHPEEAPDWLTGIDDLAPSSVGEPMLQLQPRQAVMKPAPAVDQGPELQLATDARTIATDQRRHHEVQANQMRRVEKRAKRRNSTDPWLFAVVVLAALGGAVYAFRSLQTPTLTNRPAEWAPVVQAPTSEAPPPVVTREFEDVQPRVHEITVGVSTGTANFQRLDTHEVVCTDAVECPMPVGVPIRVERANGKGTNLPALTPDQAKAGVVQVRLDR